MSGLSEREIERAALELQAQLQAAVDRFEAETGRTISLGIEEIECTVLESAVRTVWRAVVVRLHKPPHA